MASSFERKDSCFYWIRFKRADGMWGSKSSGVRVDAVGAERRISQMVADESAKEELLNVDGSAVMFKRWVPQWMEFHYTSFGTRKRYMNAWSQLSVFLDRRKVVHPAEVTYGLAVDFMKWRTDSKTAQKEGRRLAAWNTALLEIKLMGGLMQECVRRGWVASNPLTRMGFGRRNQSEKRAITRDEEKLIFDSLEQRQLTGWMAEAFLVAMRQGCRQREVAVPMDQIDTEKMVIVFNTKGGKKHAAPLHKDLLPLVAKARTEKRETLVLLPGQTAPRWAEFFESIGLVGLSFHSTRVTVVTRLCEAGFSESQTMAYVGHSSTLTHAIYRKMKPTAVAALGDVL